ncbi:MAG: hypothetical protein Q7R96_00690 [Nanoarchaeota archaeon]|nr:hypothetical protein [Nanoarchaeota archaeon]
MHKPCIQSLYHTFFDVKPEVVGQTLPSIDFNRFYMRESDCLLRTAEWSVVQSAHPKAVSVDGGLRFLYDTNDPLHPRFGVTDFKTYVAVSRMSERDMPRFSPYVHGHMRVAAVGCAVNFADKKTLVHQRPVDATHVAGRLDAGVAGLARVVAESDEIRFLPVVLDKVEKELGFTPEQLDAIRNSEGGYNLRWTGVHSSSAPDCSGMVDYCLTVPLEYGKAVEHANPARLERTLAVDTAVLPEFIVDHFLHPREQKEELIADGAAVLLNSLFLKQYTEVIAGLNAEGQRIFFGKLDRGKFVEHGWL